MRADTRGAVALLGVFFACLVVGMLYFLLGVGDTLLARERMQDSADAAAYSAAVAGARAMNLVALHNAAMSGALATAIALETIDLHAAGVLGYTVGVGLDGDSEALRALRRRKWAIDDQVFSDVTEILTAGHRASQALIDGVGGIQNRAAIESLRGSGTLVRGVFLYPAGRPLPAVPLEMPPFCEHARVPYSRPYALAEFAKLGLSGATSALVVSKFELANRPGAYMADSYGIGGACPRLVNAGTTAFGVADDVGPASEQLQLRGFAVTNHDFTRLRGGVRVADPANRGAGALGTDYARAALTGRVAFAQAEYYYTGDEDASEWLWHTGWRARLRRFVVPRGGISGAGLVGACLSRGGPNLDACQNAALVDFNRIANAIIH